MAGSPSRREIEEMMMAMRKYPPSELVRRNPEMARKLEQMDPRMMEKLMRQLADPRAMMIDYIPFADNLERSEREASPRQALEEAQGTIKELTEILERVQKEPLIVYTIDRLSKDKKHAYVKQGDKDLRIEACKDLKEGDEVLLHPKTFQIVEHIGKPPLEISRFSPDSVPNVKWEDIGGLEDAKADMIEAIETPHKFKELFNHYGKKQIKGILLSGPPGCGKTMLGKAAATALSTIYGKESSRTGFLYVKGPEVLNMFVGASEQTIREMFDDARRHKEEHGYPCIIFLDEADSILAARGGRMGMGIGGTVVPQFLTEMDGLEESSAIVIIATNRPDILDPAVVRDGRIDRKVVVSRPKMNNAIDILELNFKKLPLAHKVEARQLAEDAAALIYSSGLVDIVSGAMLANCANLAVSSAIRRDMVDGVPTGVRLDDVRAAVARLQKQSEGINHDLEG